MLRFLPLGLIAGKNILLPHIYAMNKKRYFYELPKYFTEKAVKYFESLKIKNSLIKHYTNH